MVAEETFPAVDTKNDRVHIEANKRGLQRSYGNQAVILQAWGRLEDAMALFKKQEELCLKLAENKDGLLRSYGDQAVTLKDWGRLEEALDLFKEQETLCLEGGNRSMLAHCYWMWGLLTG
jgi:tetratricopeptide (TPR) repeat protein